MGGVTRRLSTDLSLFLVVDEPEGVIEKLVGDSVSLAREVVELPLAAVAKPRSP